MLEPQTLPSSATIPMAQVFLCGLAQAHEEIFHRMSKSVDKPDSVDLFCPNCRVHVEAEVVGEHSYSEVISQAISGDPCDSQYNVYVFQLASCKRCDRPLLARRTFQEIPGEFYGPTSDVTCVYPEEESTHFVSVPSEIDRMYSEAWRAYNVHLYDACMIMCAKCVEALCIEHGQTKGTLSDRLEELQDKGIIDHSISVWANEIRLARNVAAHLDRKDRITKEDAQDMLEFTRAVLLYVFELQHRLQEFRKRRGKAPASE